MVWWCLGQVLFPMVGCLEEMWESKPGCQKTSTGKLVKPPAFVLSLFLLGD